MKKWTSEEVITCDNSFLLLIVFVNFFNCYSSYMTVSLILLHTSTQISMEYYISINFQSLIIWSFLLYSNDLSMGEMKKILDHMRKWKVILDYLPKNSFCYIQNYLNLLDLRVLNYRYEMILIYFSKIKKINDLVSSTIHFICMPEWICIFQEAARKHFQVVPLQHKLFILNLKFSYKGITSHVYIFATLNWIWIFQMTKYFNGYFIELIFVEIFPVRLLYVTVVWVLGHQEKFYRWIRRV